MDAREHLFYGLGIIAYAVAKADGEIQASEERELHLLIEEWSSQYAQEYDVTEIIFSVLKKSKPGLNEGFDEGMRFIKLGSNHLTEQLKEHFIYLIQDVAHSFPPVTELESDIISKFKKQISELH
jgi:uncharacterized tellurite resistance protein B-like protein